MLSNETRHLIVANQQEALAPHRSVHAGAGIGGYSLICAMAGDNIDFPHMDILPAEALL